MEHLSRHTMPRVTAVIAAGGVGSRLGHAGGKQLLELAGKAVLAWTVDAVASAEVVTRIIIACDPGREGEYEQRVLSETDTDKSLTFVAGGSTRQESVSRALAYLKPEEKSGIVIVHDGARPLILGEDIDEACRHLVALCKSESLSSSGESGVAGLVFGQPSVDTIKQVDEEGAVVKTLKRSELWSVQTPQIFWGQTLVDAYNAAKLSGLEGTDDASLVEYLGKRVMMYNTTRSNIKITHQEDIALASYLLEHR